MKPEKDKEQCVLETNCQVSLFLAFGFFLSLSLISQLSIFVFLDFGAIFWEGKVPDD